MGQPQQRHLDRLTRFCTAHRYTQHTDRHPDHATHNICGNRPNIYALRAGDAAQKPRWRCHTKLRHAIRQTTRYSARHIRVGNFVNAAYRDVDRGHTLHSIALARTELFTFIRMNACILLLLITCRGVGVAHGRRRSYIERFCMRCRWMLSWTEVRHGRQRPCRSRPVFRLIAPDNVTLTASIKACWRLVYRSTGAQLPRLPSVPRGWDVASRHGVLFDCCNHCSLYY